MKKFSYKSIETEMFGVPVTLEANGHIDSEGCVYITELFHCMDGGKFSVSLDDIVSSQFFRGLLEDKIQEQIK